MTRVDLIDELSKVSNLTKKESETIITIIFDNITEARAKGDKVELWGFGSFRIRRRWEDGCQGGASKALPWLRGKQN